MKRLLFPPSLQPGPLHRATGRKAAICLEFALRRKETSLVGQHLPEPVTHPLIPLQPWHREQRSNDFSESHSPGESLVYNYSSVT